MKKALLIALVFIALADFGFAQQYKVITTVESIVPMGLGRSRIIDERQGMDYKKATTVRQSKDAVSEADGKEEKQEKVDRSDLKIDNFEETKLLNFYSGVGINFQNIASNDAMISSKINAMLAEGWDLLFVTSGVESDAGKDDSKGIFITRYIFYKKA
jgi:hypothetical protein